MSAFPLACQTITFGANQKDHFEEIFRILADCGYQGAEIGFRHVCDLSPDRLKEMLDANGLVLTALHVGGNLLDTVQAAGEQREIDRVLDYAVEIGVDKILYSGLRFDNHLQFNNDLSMILNSADVCAEKGVKLLYHNHNWEFENDWRIVRTLLEQENSSLGFCPDLGWVYRSGTNLIEFLSAVRDRLVAVHLKDFSSDDATSKSTELGRGNVPFGAAAEWLEKNTKGMWVILEQDTSELAPEAAVRINAEYGRSLFKVRGA